jgi:hypothetical protein
LTFLGDGGGGDPWRMSDSFKIWLDLPGYVGPII